MKKQLVVLALSACLLCGSGCGVLLYPERQGQTQGDLDLKVVLMDGVGLIFFVVPGLVAFAIDFYQGTIFLPEPSVSSLEELKESPKVRIEGPITQASIEAALHQATGRHVDISRAYVRQIDGSKRTELAFKRLDGRAKL